MFPKYNDFIVEKKTKSKISDEFNELISILNSKKSTNEDIYDCIIRTAVTKYQWNNKIVKLSKEDINGIFNQL